MIRSFSQLCKFPTFEERFEYLKLSGIVGAETFGFDRYLNQTLYDSIRWRRVRDRVIIRDDGCDLGILDYRISDKILIHHMNPITKDHILNNDPIIFNIEYLISTSYETHRAIHFGDISLLPSKPIVRKPGDTCLWR